MLKLKEEKIVQQCWQLVSLQRAVAYFIKSNNNKKTLLPFVLFFIVLFVLIQGLTIEPMLALKLRCIACWP
jgi:hypothetical protein